MNANRIPSKSLPSSRHRLVMWFGVFTLMLSLVGPLVAIQTAEAQETLTQRLQGAPPDCDENFEPNAEGTECVPLEGNGETEQQDQEQDQEQQQDQQDQEQEQEQDQQQQIQQTPPDDQQEQVEQTDAQEQLQEAGDASSSEFSVGQDEIVLDSAYNYLDLYKYSCEVPTAPAPDADLNWYEDNCEATAQWEFALEWVGGSSLKTTDASGRATWSGLPIGSWTAREPLYYETPVVWCRYTEWPDEAGVSDQWAQFTAPNGVYSNGFGYDQMRMECRYYNIQIEEVEEEASAMILAYQFWCAPGTDQDASLDELLDACQDPGPAGTTFSLDGPNPPYDDRTIDSGPSGASVSWTPLPAGTYTITEELPDGASYRLQQVICQLAPRVIANEDDPETIQEWEIINGASVQATVSSAYLWSCGFFNFAEETSATQGTDYNYLDVDAYWCDVTAAPPADADLSWYEDNCNRNTEWEFNLSWTGGEGAELTDANGRVSWSGLPTGTWTLTENLESVIPNFDDPDFFDDPRIVWCRYTEWPDEAGVTGDWVKFEAPGGVYSNGFGYDQMRMECRWHVIFPVPTADAQPADDAGYNYLDLSKFYCPIPPAPNVDATLTWYEDNCDPVPQWQFQLEWTGGESTETTDANGQASWSGLPTGTWTASEPQLQPGDLPPAVWCRYTEWPDEAGVNGEWTLFEAPGGVYSNGFGYDQMRMECRFYNVPKPDDPVAQDADYNYLDLYKYYCQVPALPPVGAELAWYEDNCEATALWDFRLEWTGGESTETTDETGRASWSGLPTGTWTAREFLPEFYETPLVWCRYTEWPEGAAVSGEWTLFSAPGGTYSNGFGYEQMRMECRYYNIYIDDELVAQDEDYNYLDLYKFYCPVAAAPAADADLSWYEDNCEATALWDFNLEWVGGESTETTDADGRASWSGLPTGTWTATEFLPEFYETPIVWCRYTEWPDEAGITGEWAQFEAPGGVYSNGFGYDQMRMECRYYNIYIAEDDDYNYLDLYKFFCRVPAVPANAELTWYEDNCDPVGQWDFALEWVGGESTETTDAAGRASWSGLPTGTWTATEFLPESYETPTVWCRYTEWPDGAGITGEWASFTAPGGVYSNGFGYEQMRMECRYYNIFLEDENTVTVYKWDCEPGTEYGRDLAYYQGEDQDEGPCETEHLTVPLTLSDANGGHPMTTQANGTQWAGVALQNGGFRITEQIPRGYGDPMVFCGLLDQDTQSPVPATGGTISLTPATEPFAYQCNWYNILDDAEYQLEVYKYLCSADVDPSLGLPDLGTTCSPIQGVSFTATFGAEPASARNTDANGRILWTDLQMGDWSLQETMLPGWGPPKVFCGPPQTTETPVAPVVDLTVSGTLSSTVPHIICIWFNFELEQENSRITVYKYQCPPGTTTTDFGTLQQSCTVPFNGVNFTLLSSAGVVSASTSGGAIDWLNLDERIYVIQEQLLPGYEPPLVWCGYVRQDGADLDPADYAFSSYPVTDGEIQLQLNNGPARIVCYWYNFPAGPGEITINKWRCPAGYDMEAWGADPRADCTQPQNGVPFSLDRPEGADLTSATGDSLPGAVSFGGLSPGSYTVTETVPPDTAYVFVLDCTGTNIPKVHQYPLAWGNRLDVNLAADDAIVCNWYNVPYQETGSVTVYKHLCWTTTFTSAVDCEIYEFGASFELFGVPSGASYGAGTTNATGVYTWSNLDPGSYQIDEFSERPCKVTSTKADGAGNARVDAGQGTVIKVYNCTSKAPTTPGTTPGTTPMGKAPGKAPGKFPNTGVAPLTGDTIQPARQSTPEGTPQAEALAEEFYKVSCLEEPPDVPAATPTAPETDPAGAAETPEEFDLTIAVDEVDEVDDDPTPTPGATSGRVVIISRPDQADGTPAAAGSDTQAPEEECMRGALPERVEIEAANVDAGVETLEIIDGIMQQPTGPTEVTWYKETGRLGEPNNVVIAGHLNWWNVPEGVFYRLQDLQEGDRVEVTGDDGRVYVYEVQWVRQESNLEPPAADVIGPTDEPTLTLITCGGEWNADIAEYDERTVARAVQVDVTTAENADEAANIPLLARLR